MDLNGKTAWVVGASSGIGAAVARELVIRGATVAISARRRDQLEQVSGGGMLVVPADVTDAAALSEAADTVRAELGPLDVVVLAAGYWRQMSAEAWDTEVFRRHVEVNLVGMSNGIAAVLPQMLERGEASSPASPPSPATAASPAPRATARPRPRRSTCWSRCARVAPPRGAGDHHLPRASSAPR